MVCLGYQSKVLVGSFAFSVLQAVDFVFSFLLNLCSIIKFLILVSLLEMPLWADDAKEVNGKSSPAWLSENVLSVWCASLNGFWQGLALLVLKGI